MYHPTVFLQTICTFCSNSNLWWPIADIMKNQINETKKKQKKENKKKKKEIKKIKYERVKIKSKIKAKSNK